MASDWYSSLMGGSGGASPSASSTASNVFGADTGGPGSWLPLAAVALVIVFALVLATKK